MYEDMKRMDQKAVQKRNDWSLMVSLIKTDWKNRWDVARAKADQANPDRKIQNLVSRPFYLPEDESFRALIVDFSKQNSKH